MEHAREMGVLPANPLKSVKWTKLRTLASVDPRTVINVEQARRLLAAVRLHRAITFDEFLETEAAQGNEVMVRKHDTGETLIIKIL